LGFRLGLETPPGDTGGVMFDLRGQPNLPTPTAATTAASACIEHHLIVSRIEVFHVVR
jgi:hypothetical protein